ncbi:hypothetical protein DPMN_081580 [Dreissena polymorpha]|uniref:Uncharacterized protein n=1 Tax=Dreissena polymorpha TaxID=45954 RepID=A0A9D3Y7J8_DREPO|nr:hypothetical protein DPMN_081580 [Dreissena polymorpha]
MAVICLFFLVTLDDRYKTMVETGSALIFDPLGLSHCCGQEVLDGWFGATVRPSRIQSVNLNTPARTRENSPTILHKDNNTNNISTYLES